MNEAIQLLKKDANYKLGWKFSHVWEMIKNFENFQDYVGTSRQQASRGIQSSNSEGQTHILHCSQTLSSFPMSCDDEEGKGGSFSSRPIGIKKAKRKKKQSENTTSLIATL